VLLGERRSHVKRRLIEREREAKQRNEAPAAGWSGRVTLRLGFLIGTACAMKA